VTRASSALALSPLLFFFSLDPTFLFRVLMFRFTTLRHHKAVWLAGKNFIASPPLSAPPVPDKQRARVGGVKWTRARPPSRTRTSAPVVGAKKAYPDPLSDPIPSRLHSSSPSLPPAPSPRSPPAPQNYDPGTRIRV